MATGLDRLVRKEVSLGAIRELQMPNGHIGLNIAPWLDVATDDVIFDYIRDSTQEGLAPARAEDAEAELAQKDELLYGQGRAALIDWSLKDKYTASDISRYREDLLIAEATKGISAQLNLNFTGRQVADFEGRVAREDALRKRKLDNRIEWLIMTALETGALAYNDGKIKFSVDYGRPANQSNIAPAGGLWGLAASDPIGDILLQQQVHYDLYGTHLTEGIISTRILNSIWKSNNFLAALGMPVVGGTPSSPLNPNYLGLSGYNPKGALAILESATSCKFQIYDGYYRTRAIGGTTRVNTRFTSDNKVILYPGAEQLQMLDSTAVGFAKTLTSPHPEGNWQSGFYEWEDTTKDPWMHVKGSGVKAFPVFPYMELTRTLTVL